MLLSEMLPVGLTESGEGTWKRGDFRDMELGGHPDGMVEGVQRALTPLAVVAEASEGCFGSHDSWAQAVVGLGSSLSL